MNTCPKIIANRKIHEMNLNPEPFESIRSGFKTVEMRLNDEKRAVIGKGDLIRFTNNKTGQVLMVNVLDRIVYPSFIELYKCYDKISIGYNESEEADPSDMLMYYSEENIRKYGALALVIELL